MAVEIISRCVTIGNMNTSRTTITKDMDYENYNKHAFSSNY